MIKLFMLHITWLFFQLSSIVSLGEGFKRQTYASLFGVGITKSVPDFKLTANFLLMAICKSDFKLCYGWCIRWYQKCLQKLLFYKQWKTSFLPYTGSYWILHDRQPAFSTQEHLDVDKGVCLYWGRQVIFHPQVYTWGHLNILGWMSGSRQFLPSHLMCEVLSVFVFIKTIKNW